MSTGWRPIASAPKEGKPLLGYVYGRQATIYWKREPLTLTPNTGYWALCEPGEDAEDDAWTPTHWHLLPEFPYDQHIYDADVKASTTCILG